MPLRTTLRHLTECNHSYDEAKYVLRCLRADSYAEVVLDSALPIQPGASFELSAGGRIRTSCLLMDDEVALAFTLQSVKTERTRDGMRVFKVEACNVSKRPERFVAWFVGRRIGA